MKQNRKPAPASPDVLRIYTDGSYFPKVDCGGWAILLCRNGEKPRLVGGSALRTSALEMEFIAVIEAAKRVPPSTRAIILSDYQTLIKGMTKGLPRIARPDWRGINPKKIQLHHLWQKLLRASHDKRITWKWIQRSPQHPEHRYVDRYSRREATSLIERVT